MNINVDTSAADLARALGRAEAAIETATNEALDVAAQRALQAKQREIDKTYARPIPQDSNGNPKWTRSGAWQTQQVIREVSNGREIATEGSAEDYEGRLATLPQSRDGVNRRNAAAEEAARIVEPQILAIFEQELKNRLGL